MSVYRQNFPRRIAVDPQDRSGVVPGTYGDASHIPQITVDAGGRVTGVRLFAVSGAAGASVALGDNDGSLLGDNDGTVLGE